MTDNQDSDSTISSSPTPAKVNLLGLNQEEIQAAVASQKFPKFVAGQLTSWLFQKKVSRFEEMTNISKENRVKMDSLFEINCLESVRVLPSLDGSAIKHVFTFPDHVKVEAVVLKEKTYNTLCISSQGGCPVDCKFCLTGVVGFKRNLKAHEIVAQLHYVMQQGHEISNLVFMGMGEPLLNYENVFKAIDIITSPWGFGIGKRHITVSTSGYLAGIKRLIADRRFINLAFSVGHPNPIVRETIMPIEKRNPLHQVVKALKEYQDMHNRKLTLEYTLLEDKNDQPEAANELSNLAKFLDAKVNLINLNPHPRIPFRPVSRQTLLWFKDFLQGKGVPVTIRFKKGQDISAACGQLGESYLDKPARR